MRIQLHLFIIILAFLSFSLEAIDIYVSPGGSGRAEGTIDKPFHSLEEARLAASAIAGKETVNIWLADGIYYLEKPLVFTPVDGGTKEHPVYWRALHDGKAIISGGKKLNVKWEFYGDGIYMCRIPEGEVIDQLFINDRRQEMARFPNSIPDKNVFDHWTLRHRAEPDPDHDPLAPEKIASWQDPEGAYLHAMHRALWGGMHYQVNGKNQDGTLDLEGGWQNNRPNRMHGTYRFIEHVFEELDAPGEWYYSREDSKLYYYPHPAEDLQSALVEIVSLRHLVEFNGSPSEPVKHIHLEGLVLKHTARVFMETKEPLLRSDWTTYRGGALFYNGAEHCSVSSCEFDQLGGNSIFVNNYNRNIVISGCHIHESGANGIAFVGDPKMVRNPLFRYGPQDYRNLDLTPGPLGDNYPSGCLVYDCIIERTGRTEKQTAPIQISMSHRITVSHCSIYDVPRAGINISEGTFGGHVIEYCDVFNTVLETGDHGSFNSWGRDRFWDPSKPTMSKEVAAYPGLPFLDMLDPNIIRNSRWRCDHGWDIDLDDGSSWYRIYNNLLLAGGLKLREGYQREVFNNIVVNNGLHPHVWPANSGDIVTRNIFFGAHRAIGMNRAMEDDEKWGEEIDNNIFTSSDADRLLFAQNGCDLNSVVTDPQFKDPASGDFTVNRNGSIGQLGFENFPMSDFGVVSPRLKAIVKYPVFPEVHIDVDNGEVDTQTQKRVMWNDAQLVEPRGDALSAYGASMSSTGIALIQVPEFSKAWEMGFRKGDFIEAIKGKKFDGIEGFLEILEKEGSLTLEILRMQEVLELEITLD